MKDPLSDPEPLIRRVYGYVAYRIGAGADAEDVTSDVFERAVRYRSSYDAGKGAPAAWLIGIARSAVDDWLGTRRPIPVDDLGETASAADVEAETLRRVALSSAVGRLPERDRELVALRYGADLTARQIATLLEMQTNAVEVALHRALTRLRAELLPELEAGAAAHPRLAEAL